MPRGCIPNAPAGAGRGSRRRHGASGATAAPAAPAAPRRDRRRPPAETNCSSVMVAAWAARSGTTSRLLRRAVVHEAKLNAPGAARGVVARRDLPRRLHLERRRQRRHQLVDLPERLALRGRGAHPRDVRRRHERSDVAERVAHVGRDRRRSTRRCSCPSAPSRRRRRSARRSVRPARAAAS